MSALVLPFAELAADEWPSRPIRLVAPYGSGGIGDVTARIIADELSKRLSQRVFVENRPGGGGAIGTEFVVRSAPDGYTVTVLSGPQITVLPYTHKLGYDPVRDLAPVSNITSSGVMLAVNAALPVKTLGELIAYAKANPGKLNYGIAGLGTTSHLVSAAFVARDKLDMVGIPYQSVRQTLTDLIAGTLQVYVGGTVGLLEPARSGQVRALAVSNEKRIAQMPELQTMDETLPGFVFTVWQAMFAPAGTPKPILDRLSREIAAICRDPEVMKRFTAIGVDAVGGTPDDVAALIRRDLPIYQAAIDAAGLRSK